MSLQVRHLLESPDVYPQRFEGGELIFVQMSRSSYRQSIFTDPQRITTSGDDAWAVPFGDVVRLIEKNNKPLSAPAFIFHIAHCGSTLLARALDQPGSSLVVREPFALRQFAASEASQPDDDSRSEIRVRSLGALLFLLGRQYESNERVLVKANVPVNFVLGDIIRIAPEMSGILLYSKLADYIVAAVKSDQRQMWVQHVCRELRVGIRATDGFSAVDPAKLSAAKAASVLWLVQIRRFKMAIERTAGLLSLDCDRLFEDPGAVISKCAGHLGIDMTEKYLDDIVVGELFRHHSKVPDRAYSNAERLDEMRNLRELFRNDIADALEWCDKQGFDVNPEIGNRL